MTPWPGAFTTRAGKTLKVLDTCVDTSTGEANPAAPGTVIRADKRGLAACGSGAVEAAAPSSRAEGARRGATCGRRGDALGHGLGAERRGARSSPTSAIRRAMSALMHATVSAWQRDHDWQLHGRVRRVVAARPLAPGITPTRAGGSFREAQRPGAAKLVSTEIHEEIEVAMGEAESSPHRATPTGRARQSTRTAGASHPRGVPDRLHLDEALDPAAATRPPARRTSRPPSRLVRRARASRCCAARPRALRERRVDDRAASSAATSQVLGEVRQRPRRPGP